MTWGSTRRWNRKRAAGVRRTATEGESVAAKGEFSMSATSAALSLRLRDRTPAHLRALPAPEPPNDEALIVEIDRPDPSRHGKQVTLPQSNIRTVAHRK